MPLLHSTLSFPEITNMKHLCVLTYFAVLIISDTGVLNSLKTEFLLASLCGRQ